MTVTWPERTMAHVETDTLRSLYSDLVRCIDVHEILPSLFQNGVIVNVDVKERIENHGCTRMDKAKCLLDRLLVTDNPNAFCLFLDALSHTNPNLAAQLKHKLNETKPSQLRYRSLSRQAALEVQSSNRGVSAIFENGIDYTKDPALGEGQCKQRPNQRMDHRDTCGQKHVCHPSQGCSGCSSQCTVPMPHDCRCAPHTCHAASPHCHPPPSDYCHTTERSNSDVQCCPAFNHSQPCNNSMHSSQCSVDACCGSRQSPNSSLSSFNGSVHSCFNNPTCTTSGNSGQPLPSRLCSTKSCQCLPQDFENAPLIKENGSRQKRTPCEHAERISKEENDLCLTLHDYHLTETGNVAVAETSKPSEAKDSVNQTHLRRAPAEHIDLTAGSHTQYHELLSTIVWASLEMSNSDFSTVQQDLSRGGPAIGETRAAGTDMRADLRTDIAPQSRNDVTTATGNNGTAQPRNDVKTGAGNNPPSQSTRDSTTDTHPMKLRLKRSDATFDESTSDKSSTLPARFDNTNLTSKSLGVDISGSSEEDEPTSPGFKKIHNKTFPRDTRHLKVGFERKKAIRRKGQQSCNF